MIRPTFARKARVRVVGGMAVLFAVAAIAGCGAGGEAVSDAPPASPAKVSAEPVTLTVAVDSITVGDEVFAPLKEQLAKKYPNITLDVKSGAGSKLEELIVSGSIPDIVFSYNGRVASYNQTDLLQDITPLVKSGNIDLQRFEPNYLADAKIASDKNELFGLPFRIDFHAMYYNKSIFDKFGVPYPRDGLVWDQVIDLARATTRMDGGVQFRGLDSGSFVWMAQPLSLREIDPTTNKATINTENWKRVFELYKRIWSIPGNEKVSKPPIADQFLKTQTLAMFLSVNNLAAMGKSEVDWDVAQYPSYPEKPNTYGNGSVHMALIAKTSKHKEQAIQVLDVLTAPPFQMQLSRMAMLSPLRDADIRKAFGADTPYAKGKNLQGIFKSHPVPYPVASIYRPDAEKIVNSKINAYLQGKVDVNTALKQAEEEINQMVASK